jgi:small-conductance mechanosensitive channel
LLLVLVFLVALSNAGMQLDKFTLVTGALGVGVGFGLQNIVNNFVSGLILLFERPIRVGDTVEMKGLIGTVQRIGARSSTIHTFEDAEVIVPNSNLVSNEVINWTLSSLRRRVAIQVGVAYGTDPELVLSLLVSVAAANSAVIKNPKPEAFFLGFGDSALNFELRFWTYQEAWFNLKSQVAVSLMKALGEANIEIPFPQRELRIRSDDGKAAEPQEAPRTPNSPQR